MEPEEKSNGALVGSIIIIVILILGGAYFLKTSMKNQPATPEDTSTIESNTNVDTTEVENELNSIDLETLDSEI